jgi:NAD(P)-dependent dehydrogenase (short-subunit alcohol dehydrogenase family)
MSEVQTAMSQTYRDPRAGARPPFGEQEQAPPGSDAELQPKADHGEESYEGSGKLEGLAAVVTGGDSGLGRAVALAFAREGADVLISYLNEDEDAAETAALIEGAGRKAVQVRGDLTDPEHGKSVIENAVAQLGRLDILVNNAATQTVHSKFEEITDEEVELVFRTNVFPLFTLSRAAIPHLPAGGTIINTASIQAYDPSAPLLHYATTKGAIVTFTKGLSDELIERGIRVNAVAPGPVWTPLIASTMPGEKVSKFGETNPTGRPAQPAELAPAYVFLASADSRFVTGEVIGVTGGRRLS